MKGISALSVAVLVALVATNYVAAAEREDPLQIFSVLKRAQRVLAGPADYLVSGQGEVLALEEDYIRSSLNDETALLNLLAGDDVQRHGPNCVQFARTSVDLLMKLAGVGYTNCFNEIDEQLFGKLSELPNFALTREQYDRMNLLGAFRGENIFIDPGQIRSKLAERLAALVQIPTISADAMASLTAAFADMKNTLRTCFANTQSRLAANLSFTSQQVRAICAGEMLRQ